MFDGELIVCRNEESAVFEMPLSASWERFKSLDLSCLFPSTVKSCSLLIPLGDSAKHTVEQRVNILGVPYEAVAIEPSPFRCALATGSLRRVEYKDGAVFVYKVMEISELRHSIAFELIHSNSSMTVSGIVHIITLQAVTETSSTFIHWETVFSGDADYNFYHDTKFKKLDAFKDLRLSLGFRV